MKTLKKYPGLRMMPVELDYEGRLCTASIAETTSVQSNGQEVGMSVDFTESESFNHVWESL